MRQKGTRRLTSEWLILLDLSDVQWIKKSASRSTKVAKKHRKYKRAVKKGFMDSIPRTDKDMYDPGAH